MAGGAVAVSGAVGVPEGIGRIVAPTMTVGTVVAGSAEATAKPSAALVILKWLWIEATAPLITALS